MDNGGEQDQDIKEGTSTPNDKRVSLTPPTDSVSPTDLETANVKEVENAADNTTLDSSVSDFSSHVHVSPQVIPLPVESNNVCPSNDKADVTLDSSDSKSSSDDKAAHVPPQVLPQPVESNNADTPSFGNDKADVIGNASDSSDSHKHQHVPHQLLPESGELNNACQSNADTQPFGNDKAKVTDNASDSSYSSSSSNDEDAHAPCQALHQSEEPNNVCQPKAESTSQHSNTTCEPLPPNISLMMSPPIQVMEKHQQESGSNMSKPSASSKPQNWGTTSNESLFSIRFKSNSFSGVPVPTMDEDLAKSENLHKSGELSISDSVELFPVGDPEELTMSEELSTSMSESEELFTVEDPEELPMSGEFPMSEEIYKPKESLPGSDVRSYQSEELYKPKESFTGSDVIIQGGLVQGVSVRDNRASSVSKEEEIRWDYVPQGNKGSKKSSDSSTPILNSSKSGANAQTSVFPPEKRSRKWLLFWPAFVRKVVAPANYANAAHGQAVLGIAIRRKGVAALNVLPHLKWFKWSSCFKCSAPSCKWFKWSSCFKCSAPSCKWFKWSSCSGKSCCYCCSTGSSCWSFKSFGCSGNCCSCFSNFWCAKRRNPS